MYYDYKNYIKSNNLKTQFRENSDILFLNSSFCFRNSYISEKFFKFSLFYNIYSRFSNPNLNNLEKKIAFLEDSKYCLSFSSGMSAIFAIFINFLKTFECFSSSLNLFGSTLNFFLNFLSKFHIFVIFINYLEINNFNSIIFFIKIFFFETPSNPLVKLYNIKIISYLSFKYNILFFIDNTFSTPILQNPTWNSVDFVLHSCTKFFDGQGRILGGAIVTNKILLFTSIFSFFRFSGFTMSSFNSWLIYKSLDLLFIRIKNQIHNSFFFFKIFKYNSFILKVFYSGVLNYNQYKIFIYQQIYSNSVFSFIIKGNTFELYRINAWKIMDKLFYLNTPNLGDVFTIITNCSITTHNFLNFLEKLIISIYDSLLRISFGLEDIFDLYYNLILNFNNI